METPESSWISWIDPSCSTTNGESEHRGDDVATSGVDVMPLPDAEKKSKRVYRLLQTKDLTLSFDQFDDVGKPITIEEMNEDELRRLVLVNLARLTVKGEWNGIL